MNGIVVPALIIQEYDYEANSIFHMQFVSYFQAIVNQDKEFCCFSLFDTPITLRARDQLRSVRVLC